MYLGCDQRGPDRRGDCCGRSTAEVVSRRWFTGFLFHTCCQIRFRIPDRYEHCLRTNLRLRKDKPRLSWLVKVNVLDSKLKAVVHGRLTFIRCTRFKTTFFSSLAGDIVLEFQLNPFWFTDVLQPRWYYIYAADSTDSIPFSRTHTCPHFTRCQAGSTAEGSPAAPPPGASDIEGNEMSGQAAPQTGEAGRS